MKIRIILFLSIISLLIAGLCIWIFFTSFHNVNFIVKQSDLVIDVYKDNKSNSNSKILSFSTPESVLSLKNGDYYYISTGKKTDLSKHQFTVTSSTKEVVIDPDYSSTYLAAVLSSEQNNIEKVISDTYPESILDYTIQQGVLFQKGEWFGTIIKKNIDLRDIADPYRIILHKENNNWVIIHYPEIVVTKANFPDVPISVLTAVNNLLDS